MTTRRDGLVGRHVELRRLEALVTGAARGRGGVLVLVGEAGIGKTRLVEALPGIGARHDVAVLLGQARPLQIERPLGPVLDALDLDVADAARADVTADRSVLVAAASTAPSFQLRESALEAVESYAARRPLVLVVEDLHWADPTTVSWLDALGTRAAGLPLAVVATSRPPLPGTPTARLLATGVEHLELAGLARAEVGSLVEHLLGAPPGTALLTALESARGNPLLVQAVVEALGASDAIVLDHGTADVAASALVPYAPPILSRRFDELDPESRRAVQVAAVVGGELDVDVVAAIAGRRVYDVLASLDAAVSAGVLAGDGRTVRFRHELHREAVLATMPSPVRAALHLDAARVLRARGAPVLTVAEHYAHGAQTGDRDAIEWLTAAAAAIVERTPGAALDVIDHALSLVVDEPSAELLLLRVRALAASGRVDVAVALCTSLLHDHLDPSFAAALHRELALAAFIQGRAADCVAAMERHEALVTDPARRARVQGELAFARFFALEHDVARASATEGITTGRRHGDLAAQVAGGSVLCALELFANDFGRACDLAREIVVLADQPHAGGAHVYQPWFLAALAWLEADDLERARSVVSRGRTVAAATGAAWAIPGYDALAAYASLRAGELGDAAAAAEAGLSYLEGVDGFGITVWCHAFLAQVLLHRGEPDAADRHLGAAEQVLVTGRAQFGFEQVMIGRARWCERLGDCAGARKALADAWDTFGAVGVRSARPALGVDLVRLAVAAGERDRAAEVVEGLDDAADTAGTPAFRAFAEMAHALLRDDPDRALGAVDLARRTPRRLVVASMLATAAEMLRRAKRPAEADAAASEAIAGFAACGADADADAVAVAGRSAVPAPARRPRFGLEALTTTERAVVDLVAEGLANPDIAARLHVSRRTVESHVSAAYRKLGVATRVELARLVLDPRDPLRDR